MTEDQLNNNCGSLFDVAAQPITVTVCDFEAIYEAEQAFWEAIDVLDISDEEFFENADRSDLVRVEVAEPEPPAV